ncbi:hypothetical protein [Alloalcanivorax gelatiniphagus]|uniref:SPOR domain-containing protein n=1 Tax=Alloalcanivorax gelatiniphagus TaxID=1194167 RepID=A0ABY2XM26_9GAMM|nr:hypothetical protein [Alloalcanivorax gelatiniphagus]TMW12868.1 hypothetical protein FGS76_09470 [Alloalcanivorax gelatiniphagus]|tara:strand:- start:14482 stop:14661 length:180 start_codon:yes stop_codon:yes gene_type:complete
MAAGNTQYVLWRKDGHGKVFVVTRFHSRQHADRVCQSYQQRAHKQHYWVTMLRLRDTPP